MEERGSTGRFSPKWERARQKIFVRPVFGGLRGVSPLRGATNRTLRNTNHP